MICTKDLDYMPGKEPHIFRNEYYAQQNMFSVAWCNMCFCYTSVTASQLCLHLVIAAMR